MASKTKDLEPGCICFVVHELVAVSGELDPLLALDILEGFVSADSNNIVGLDVDDRGSTVCGDQGSVAFSHFVVAAEGVEVFQLVSS